MSCPLQAHKALQHQVQDVTSAQLASLSQELDQLRQRHEAGAAKAASDAAATRAQVAELRQWFDANQVRPTTKLFVVCFRQVTDGLTQLLSESCCCRSVCFALVLRAACFAASSSAWLC